MLGDTTSVLEVDGISKLYSRSSAESRRRLAAFRWHAIAGRELQPIGVLQPGEFWGLKDVSFSLQRGEALGVIGLNGSGKTTLLRILAGQILPDAGEIRIVGRTAAMIDLTAGFQMGASGRENIYLRGAMLGRSRAEMEAAAPEIIDFTELGAAIEAPIRTYSSGMLMRLAFAIMVASTPDILFIDEILAVGDFRFRQKCLAKIREMRERSAFVFVSHSMPDIRRFCDKVIVLESGRISFMGETSVAIEKFMNSDDRPPVATFPLKGYATPESFHNRQVLTSVDHWWTTKTGETGEISPNDDITIFIRFKATETPRNTIIGLTMLSMDGDALFGVASDLDSFTPDVQAGKLSTFRIHFPRLAVNPGQYKLIVSVRDGPERLYRGVVGLLSIKHQGKHHFGVMSPDRSWASE